ncbi:MAG: hypothetical protein SO007_01115, partial [Candidatus Enteromonas sp.]|nr:hypothetical protein [Candidatus Enteromonas sp.]
MGTTFAATADESLHAIARAAVFGYAFASAVWARFRMAAVDEAYFLLALPAMLIFRSLCKYILKSIPTDGGQQQQTYQLIDYYNSPYYSIGNDSLITIPIVGIILIILVLLVYYFAKHTKFGRKIYALGSNSKAASLAGINV